MNKLLIIMDDWEKLERFEERFRPHFEVITAPGGDYAIETALDQRPDLILACLAFEAMDERTLQIELRGHELLAQTPVVYLSEEHGENANPTDLDVVIQQPAHFELILETLQKF
ncbi:MAG: hypothetical protein EOP09_06905 [Proteobacteria bacterium]|nr:MAG: hypothetical protein EOP09_06905 [Pseudomonadota bacterium]